MLVVSGILIYLYYYYIFPKNIRSISKHDKGNTTFINEDMFINQLSVEYNTIWYYIDGKNNKIISIDNLKLNDYIIPFVFVIFFYISDCKYTGAFGSIHNT